MRQPELPFDLPVMRAPEVEQIVKDNNETFHIDWRREGGWSTLESLLGISVEGGPVTISEALTSNAMLAAVDVISRDVSKVPLIMWERIKGGGKRRVEPNEHWFAKMLVLDPNREHNWHEFMQILAIHIALSSNAFIVKRMNIKGDVQELIPVLPGRVTIHFHPDTGEKFYYLSPGTNFEQAMLRGIGSIATSEEIIHLRKRILDGVHGLSTLVAGAGTIRLAKALQNYQTRLYTNDGQTRLVFEQDGSMKPLSDPSFNRMKNELRQATETMMRQGKPILLEPGYKGRTLAMNAADAELSKSDASQIKAVARMLGVPPYKIWHFEDEKYNNLETIERAYVNDTVLPYALAIEQPLERSIFTEEERLKYFIEIDRNKLTVIDFKQRSEALKVGLQHGAVCPDEYREAFGLNPLPKKAGQIRFVQSTMNVIDENNEVVIAAGGKGQDGEDTADEAPKKGLTLVHSN